jgi:hypothetical protein
MLAERRLEFQLAGGFSVLLLFQENGEGTNGPHPARPDGESD